MIPIPVLGKRWRVLDLFKRRQGAWLEPRAGYMWQEHTGATATTTGGQTVGKLVDLTAARVASQATAANRPIYGVRRNLLTYSEDFSQSIWVKANCTLIASNATAPDGSNTAATFRFLNASYAEVYQGAGLAQLAGVLRLGFYTIWIRRRAGSGQVRLKIPQGTAYTDIAVTAEWQKFTSATTNPFTTFVEYYPGINLNEVNGELDIWHPYMTFADAPDDFGGYQRITTATDYDPGPYPALAHDSTDSLSVALPDLGGGVFSSSGSVYFGVPQGMSALHNQSMGTAYTLPALNSDIYGWCVFPERLTQPEEAQLERYFLRLAGISGGPDYLLDDDYNQLTDDAGELLLRA